MHHHRAEHWVVVRGTALVEKDGVEEMVGENQSTYIPLGARHRLINPGKIPVEMIEVQSGAYLGEDDIVRFDDRYGRSNTKGESGLRADPVPLTVADAAALAAGGRTP
jgi:mannose-1-phosphate guanylyltransferase